MMPTAYVKALHPSAEERRSGCGGDLRGGAAAFDAVGRRALAGEPGDVEMRPNLGQVDEPIHIAKQQPSGTYRSRLKP
jgi:hypothetical protein